MFSVWLRVLAALLPISFSLIAFISAEFISLLDLSYPFCLFCARSHFHFSTVLWIRRSLWAHCLKYRTKTSSVGMSVRSPSRLRGQICCVLWKMALTPPIARNAKFEHTLNTGHADVTTRQLETAQMNESGSSRSWKTKIRHQGWCGRNRADGHFICSIGPPAQVEY